MWAITLYFIAVFFVIIGTYCLFTSLSILALKALKKNKRYYYKSKHFITVSGMLYRMKRNGVGLANICIIATMVMVMISGTLSMYLGAGEMVELSAPTDIVMQARHYYSYTEGEDEETRVPMDTESSTPTPSPATQSSALSRRAGIRWSICVSRLKSPGRATTGCGSRPQCI